jgi:hypothetical protein
MVFLCRSHSRTQLEELRSKSKDPYHANSTHLRRQSHPCG